MDYLKKLEKDLKEAERLRDLNPNLFTQELERLYKSVQRYKASAQRTNEETDDMRNRTAHQAALLKASALAQTISSLIQESSEQGGGDSSGGGMIGGLEKLGSGYMLAVMIVIVVLFILIFT